MGRKQQYIVILCLIFSIVAMAILLSGNFKKNSSPAYYLWAWQRSEDLNFIDPDTTGIALWVGGIILAESEIDVQPRENPVRYPVGTDVIAVVRVDAPGRHDLTRAKELAGVIKNIVAPYDYSELQLDFDARLSQRDFYRELLTELRILLPNKSLSITALVSWCLSDNWIEELPIDSAVPMMYRMGEESERIRHYLSDDGHFSAKICMDNIGYSSDEPLVPAGRARRIFLYHPVAWQQNDFDSMKREIENAWKDY